MAERPSGNPDLKIPTLGGLNERPSPANLQTGQFDVLEGLYPAQIGLLRRIPNRSLLASFTGKIINFGITDNPNGDILIPTSGGNLYVVTRDELLGRSSAPSLTFTPIAEEETMSIAIIVQKETNAINGGSAQGYISGTDSTAQADTFYPRRLTHELSDADGFVTLNAPGTNIRGSSVGDGTATASWGTFTVAAGTYRISADIVFRCENAAANVSFIAGLYNLSTSLMQVHAGGAGTDPILSTLVSNTSTASTKSSNMIARMEGVFTLGGTNNLAIYHKCSNATAAQDKACCGLGNASLTSTTNLAGVAAPFYYTHIKLLKVSA